MHICIYIYIYDIYTYIISYIYIIIYIYINVCSVFVLLLLVHKSLSIIVCNYCRHKFSRYVIGCVCICHMLCVCVWCVFGCACLGECVVYDVHFCWENR